MEGIIYAVIFFVILGSFYCLGYYLNHLIPKPEGCEKLESGCDGCGITSCLKNPIYEKVEENKNA